MIKDHKNIKNIYTKSPKLMIDFSSWIMPLLEIDYVTVWRRAKDEIILVDDH